MNLNTTEIQFYEYCGSLFNLNFMNVLDSSTVPHYANIYFLMRFTKLLKNSWLMMKDLF